MEAYSEDLRKKIVDAVEQRGMGQSEAAHLFEVSLSSVKRYLRKFRQCRPLSPGKAPGKRPIIDELARRLCSKRISKSARSSPSENAASTCGLWPDWRSAALLCAAP